MGEIVYQWMSSRVNHPIVPGLCVVFLFFEKGTIRAYEFYANILQ